MITIEMNNFEQVCTNKKQNRWKEKIDQIIIKNMSYYTKITRNSVQNKNSYIIGIQSVDNPSIIMRALWSFEVKMEILLINIKTIDSQSNNIGYRNGEQQYFNEQFQVYLQQLNIKNKHIQGCFYTQKKTKFELCYSIQISVNIIQNHMSLNLFLANILRLFSQQLNRFANHFNLFNQKLKQNENKMAKQLKRYNETRTQYSFTLLNRMRIIKQHYENQRIKRQKSTTCCLGFNKIKIINYLQETLLTGFLDLKRFKLPEYISKNQIKQIYEDTKNSQELKEKKQFDQNKGQFIICPIQIKTIEREEYYLEGGFSKIKKGLYEFQFCQTIYANQYKESKLEFKEPNNRKQFQYENNYPMKLKKQLLIKKQPKEKDDESFQNQFKFLVFLRNKKERYIAHYYIDITVLKNPEDKIVNEIFLDIYECTLKQIMRKLSKRKKIRILNQIIRGLSFLQANKILHRDLKEQNIMIDKQQNARIIDFGSSCGFYENQKDDFNVQFNHLRSTPGYYLSYQDVNGTSITAKYTQQQYEQSPFFDIYSFGHIIQCLFEKQFNQCETIIDYELHYLSKKCKQLNPADRLSCQQVKLYLNLIIYLFIDESSMLAKQKVRKKSMVQ